MASASNSAAELRRRAGSLRRSAHLIDVAELWVLRRRAGEDVWIGPTASAFLDDLTVAEAQLRAAYEELCDAARRLELLADQAEAIANAALVPLVGAS